jgi:hypothetical protein
MAIQVQLPSPVTQVGSFTLNAPQGSYVFAVVADNVFMNVLIQSVNTIPTNPPTTPITFQYRMLNTSFRDETATQLNNFIAFICLTTGTYILTQIQALT